MNLGALAGRAKSLGSQADWLSIKDGHNVVRFVSSGEDMPWRECYRHFLQRVIKDDGVSKAPVCLGGPELCPACQYVEQLRLKGEDKSAEMSRSSRRFLWVVISRDNPFNSDGALCLKFLELPVSAFHGINKMGQEWGIDFTDPVVGYDVNILRTPGIGSGFTKYEVEAVTKREGATKTVVATPLTAEEKKLVEESFPDLDSQIQPPDVVQLAAALGVAVPEKIPPRVRNTGGFNNGTTKSSDTSATGVGSTDVVVPCQVYGQDYDPTEEACRECSKAVPCAEDTAKFKAVQTPKRRAV